MNPSTLDRLTVPLSDRDHHLGPLPAPSTLLEYGDYECPFCAEAYPLIEAVRRHFGNRVCIAYRHFPLTNMHPHAERAAEAAEAAATQGKFWEMHDALYENQHALELEDIAAYAAELQLDPDRLLHEVISGAHRERVREDFASGVRSGVNGTPSLFINDLRYDGPRDFPSIVVALERS